MLAKLYALFLVFAAFWTISPKVHAESTQDSKLLGWLAEGKHDQLYLALDRDPELVFRSINGKALAVYAALFGNHTAAIELIDRGADWLAQSSEGVSFCTLVTQRIRSENARLIGAAIARRVSTELQFINAQQFDTFVVTRLSARQPSSFLEATRTWCGTIIAKEDGELLDPAGFLRKIIATAKSPGEAAEHLAKVRELDLVAFPNPSSGNPQGSSWAALLLELSRKNYFETVKAMLRGERNVHALTVLFSRNDLSLVYITRAIAENPEPEKFFSLPVFSEALASEFRRKETEGLEIIEIIQKLGLERTLSANPSLVNSAVRVFEAQGSRNLLEIVLASAWNDKDSCLRDVCSVDASLFSGTSGPKLTMFDFIRLHERGFALRGDRNPLRSVLDLGDVFKLIDDLTKFDTPSQEKAIAITRSFEGMSRYPITWTGISASAQEMIGLPTEELVKRHSLLLDHAMWRNMKCGGSYRDKCELFSGSGYWNKEREQSLETLDKTIAAKWISLGLKK